MNRRTAPSLLTMYAREIGDAGASESDPAKADQFRTLASALTRLELMERYFDKLDNAEPKQ